MKSDPERYKLTGFDSVMKYVGMLMASLWVGMGGFLIAKSPEYEAVNNKFAFPLGCAMICYGLFRGYRSFQRYFRNE